MADEINRAPAKVQSALLEAMQERQVTLGDHTHPLPSPFLVLATQNPIEQEGTYPLPEAQIDRFLLKVNVGYPTPDEALLILEAMATSRPQLDVRPVVSLGGILAARELVDAVYVDEKIKRYIVSLVVATRDPRALGLTLDGLIRYGASPRATIGLTLSAKAWAFLHGRGYVTPQDVKMMAPDVLRHRVGADLQGGSRTGHRRRRRHLHPRPRRHSMTTLTPHRRRAIASPVEPVNPERIRRVMDKVRQIEIRTRRQVDEMLAGRYQSVFRGRGIDFDSVREYVPGDEIRIDRLERDRPSRPPLREDVPRGTRALRLDPGRRLGLGRLRLGRHDQARAGRRAGLRAGALGGAQQRQGGAHMFSDRIEVEVPPAKGRGHAMRVVRDILNCLPLGRGTDLAAALDLVGRRALRRSVVFLISDFGLPDDGGAAGAALLRAAHPSARGTT